MDTYNRNYIRDKQYIQNNKKPIICIPCVSKDIKKGFIFNIFIKLKIGHIKSIDIYNNKSDTNIVIIKFDYWYKSKKAKDIKKQLIDNKEFNLVYKFPEYWKCLLYIHMKQ